MLMLSVRAPRVPLLLLGRRVVVLLLKLVRDILRELAIIYDGRWNLLLLLGIRLQGTPVSFTKLLLHVLLRLELGRMPPLLSV